MTEESGETIMVNSASEERDKKGKVQLVPKNLPVSKPKEKAKMPELEVYQQVTCLQDVRDALPEEYKAEKVEKDSKELKKAPLPPTAGLDVPGLIGCPSFTKSVATDERYVESVEVEARSRMMWGEPLGVVLEWMTRDKKIPVQDAKSFLNKCDDERDNLIRSYGKNEMKRWGAILLRILLISFIVAFAARFTNFSTLFAYIIFIGLPTTIVACLYPFFRFIFGCIHFFFGNTLGGNTWQME